MNGIELECSSKSSTLTLSGQLVDYYIRDTGSWLFHCEHLDSLARYQEDTQGYGSLRVGMLEAHIERSHYNCFLWPYYVRRLQERKFDGTRVHGTVVDKMSAREWWLR
jgi:hypothetical protein